MKRFLITLFAIGLVAVLFAACGDPVETTDPKATSTTTPAPATSTTPITTGIPGALSSEERAELENMVSANIERANVIAQSTIDKYGTAFMGYTLAESFNTKTNRSEGLASVWHYTSYYAMISRLVEIAETGSTSYEEYTELSEKVYKGFRMYSGTADIITYLGTFEKTMYGVNRANAAGAANVAGDQAVYDDQMWIIREMVYRYKQTNDQQYLDEAVRLAKICIEGWDYSLDEDGKEYGGIPWGPYYSSKHTCSNAPIVAPLVEIYEILKAQESTMADYYLEWAVKIYEYTKEHLRNSSGRYGDSTGYTRVQKTTSNGKLKYVSIGTTGFDSTEYTYNTGAMISGAAALYRATGKNTYLTDAKNAARAAYTGFCKRTSVDGTKVPYYPITSQTTWFNLVLMQGFLDLYDVAPEKTYKTYILSFQESIDYAYEHYLKNGLLPRDYANGWNNQSSFDTSKNVMDQASASQTYAMLALWAQKLLDADDALLAAAQ